MRYAMVARRGIVLVVGCMLATLGVTPASAVPATTLRVPGLEHRVMQELNQVRAARGLRLLSASPGLRVSALAHANDMLSGGFFQHESADGTPFWERIKKTYPPRPNAAWVVGENLFAKSAEPTAREAVVTWLASPPHRGIVLSPKWRDVGIAVVRAPHAGGDFGGQPTWIVTADFGSRSG